MGRKKFEYEIDKLIEKYGYQFVKEAVEQAVLIQEVKQREKDRMTEAMGETRVKKMAREMGVRLG